MVLLCPRIHLFEIDDQPWFPKFLRRKIQSCLALCWTLHIPIIQPSSPAQLAAITLCRTLSDDVTSYTFVDFCAGAGGPTPYIEVYVNAHLKNKSSTTTHGASYAEVAAAPKAAHGLTPRSPRPVDEDHGHGDDRDGKVQFVLTDIHPHIPDWTAASKRSPNLTFIPKSVDAANAPRDILKKVHVGSHMNGANGEKKVFRLYNLAFHHFGQELASKILKNTMETADGFAIFELQERDLSSFVTIFGMIIAITIMTPFYFWRSPSHLFFTFIIPIIPFVLFFDGIISSLRTWTAGEVESLMRKSGGDMEGWRVLSGREIHTWPTGSMIWFMGIKG